MENQQNVVSQFANSLCRRRDSARPLHINMSGFSIVTADDRWEISSGYDWEEKLNNEKTFDFIFGDFPIGSAKASIELFGSHEKHRRNWVEILKSLSHLSEGGMGVFVVEPTAFYMPEGERFTNLLRRIGWNVQAIISTPEKAFGPFTMIRPSLVCLSRLHCESLFIGELFDSVQAEKMLENYSSGVAGEDLATGIFLSTDTFKGFPRVRAELQLRRFESQYKKYQSVPLEKLLAKEINLVPRGAMFEEADNCIYLQKSGGIGVFTSAAEIESKAHNFYKISLNKEVSNLYVREFLTSELGVFLLKSVSAGTHPVNSILSELKDLPISLPSPDIQRTIASTAVKLKQLSVAVSGIQNKLALNPEGSFDLLRKLESMLEVVGELTESDRVLSACRQGESKTVEFKESLSLDVAKGTKESYIEQSALKTVAAFLNSEGGTLLVGVRDSGEVSGIDVEIDKFHKTTDKFLLHFKNLLKTKIGEEYYTFINYGPVRVSGRQVLMVSCKPSKIPCYFGGSDFFVRTNPATDKLEGQKLVDYVNNHFPK